VNELAAKMIVGDEPEGQYLGWLVAAAVALSAAHLISVCGMAYQSHWKSDHFALINYAVWLSPVLLPLLSRKSCVLLMICATPILVIFCARIYFAWQLYSLGSNSIRPNGDWAWWLTTFLGAISILIVLLWVLIRAAIRVVNFVIPAGKKPRS
jgi:hypothetical protein